jgi:hypothetical protein
VTLLIPNQPSVLAGEMGDVTSCDEDRERPEILVGRLLGGEGSAVIGRMGPRLALLFACLWWFGQRSSPSEHLFGWIAFARCMNACTCTVSLYEDTCRRSPVASSESCRREPPHPWLDWEIQNIQGWGRYSYSLLRGVSEDSSVITRGTRVACNQGSSS